MNQGKVMQTSTELQRNSSMIKAKDQNFQQEEYVYEYNESTRKTRIETRSVNIVKALLRQKEKIIPAQYEETRNCKDQEQRSTYNPTQNFRNERKMLIQIQNTIEHANDDDYKGGTAREDKRGGAIIHYNECGKVK